MSTERLRQLRREFEAGGFEALRPGTHGGPRRLSDREVARLRQAFPKGLGATAAHATMRGVSLPPLGAERPKTGFMLPIPLYVAYPLTLSSAQTETFLKSEADRWIPLLRRAGVTVE